MRIWAVLWLALVAWWPAAAEPWREASSAHFVVYSQDSEASLRRFAQQLERFDKALHQLQGMADLPVGDANRLTIFVVSNSLAVQKLMGKTNTGVAGFYRGNAGRSIAVTSRESTGSRLDLQPIIVLLHEYAHHFMLRNFPAAYPGWFREGFAEFYSTSRFEPDGGLTIGIPANHRVGDLAFVGDPNLPAMLADGKRGVSPSELYGYGWLLTHYLTFSEARQGQLKTYLDAINRGVPAATASTQAFGDLRVLEREMRSYLSHRTMRIHTVEAKLLPIGPVTLRTLDPAEQAIMPVMMRSTVGVTSRTAGDVAKDARAAAAPFPASAPAQLALAEAELDADGLDAADAAADRAIAADPRPLRALLFKAMIRLKRAAKAEGAAKTALVKEARGFITRANRIDPDDPQPLILFYQSYAAMEAKPTENAVIGLTVAQQLAPEDDTLRLLLAKQWLDDKQPANVRALLAPLAYAPHGGSEAALAQAMLARIEPAAPASTQAPATGGQ